MSKSKALWLVHAASAATMLMLSAAANADAYPSKPIKVVVGYGPGSTNDVRVRQITEPLARALGQPVIVENRAGAAGTLGAAYAARAPADGYTLYYGGATEMAVEPALRADLAYDVQRDFTPIVQLAFSPAILVVSTAVGATSVKELLLLAKAKPGALTCASPGSGSLAHLLLVQLQREGGVEIAHVPYKNPGEALPDVVAGHVTMAFDYMVSSGALIRAGKLRPVMVVGQARLSVLPDTPSAAESGLAGVDRLGWAGFFAPAATPPSIVTRLNEEIVRIMRSPEMVEIVAQSGARIVAGSPQAFAALVKEEQTRFRALAKELDLKRQ